MSHGGYTNLVEYTGAAIAGASAVRSFPNPPTGDGADVSSWDGSHGSRAEFELTILAGATVQLAAGAMLVAEEVLDTYPEESIAVVAEADDEIFTLAAHGFYTGDGPVTFTAAALPTGISATVEYYIIRLTANTFQVAASRAAALAGTEVTYTTDGTTVVMHWVTGVKSVSQAASAITDAADTYTIAGHGLVTAERVQVANSGGAIPTGLAADTDYYVIVVDNATIQFASSPANATAGTEITWTGGSGTQSVINNNYGPTSATVFSKFSVLNEGAAIALTSTIGYRERISHRPSVVAYHLVATLDVFVPVTWYVRGVRYVE